MTERVSTGQLLEWKDLAERLRLLDKQNASASIVWRSPRERVFGEAATALDQSVAEVERLREEKIELNKGILELQREMCARDSVPMPSERPVVDKLREALALATTIIRQMPQNGDNWDTVSRFWAALPETPK